jgi:hypothetical protein
MFVNVRLDLPLGDQLAIPASGVYQSGTRQIAFVDHGGNLPAEFDDVVARKSEEIADVRGVSLHRGEERLRFGKPSITGRPGKDFGASGDSAAADRVCLGRGNFAHVGMGIFAHSSPDPNWPN